MGEFGYRTGCQCYLDEFYRDTLRLMRLVLMDSLVNGSWSNLLYISPRNIDGTKRSPDTIKKQLRVLIIAGC